MKDSRLSLIENKIDEIHGTELTPLDLLPQAELREKLIELVLKGIPPHIHSVARSKLQELRSLLLETNVDHVKLVVFGGGTGLSNIIGGDSRQSNWGTNPFVGLKEVFPGTNSIVCVTDNGGSTGELLKDLDLIAIGDLRHVLLSSIKLSILQKKYYLDRTEAKKTTADLAEIFNWRFSGPLDRQHPGWPRIVNLIKDLPTPLKGYFEHLFNYLFKATNFNEVLKRSHCFGNLLVAAAIYRERGKDEKKTENENLHEAIKNGLKGLGSAIGAGPRAVMPCTSTSAQLRIRYTNGVEITGEHKLSSVKRGVPVDRVEVDYCEEPKVYKEVLEDIANADLIILAPGSLYSSIIPVFKVPGLAEAVRQNRNALKVLISNLWVQAGETDLSIADPERKFHVSDMISAYETNIPGGIRGLFHEILCVSLKEIPASILQSYAVEGKVPIYLDKEKLSTYNFTPVECDIYSRKAILERGVIQHDPDNLALAIKGLFNGRTCYMEKKGPLSRECPTRIQHGNISGDGKKFHKPFQKFTHIIDRLDKLKIKYIGESGDSDASSLKNNMAEILWDHPIIPLRHLDYFKDIHCIAPELWNRDQKWDNVFSFFDPSDFCLKIRADQVGERENLEIALMIAIGESLLGDYAVDKHMEKVFYDGIELGRAYHLHIRPEWERRCYLKHEEMKTFLSLSRMRNTNDENHYTRLVNKGEGFTPPGLLMGLMYLWYVDNRLATHIEYKMSVIRISKSDLIPEQLRMAERRRRMIDFFREVIFKGD